jgi:hypothetical protein
VRPPLARLEQRHDCDKGSGSDRGAARDEPKEIGVGLALRDAPLSSSCCAELSVVAERDGGRWLNEIESKRKQIGEPELLQSELTRSWRHSRHLTLAAASPISLSRCAPQLSSPPAVCCCCCSVRPKTGDKGQRGPQWGRPPSRGGATHQQRQTSASVHLPVPSFLLVLLPVPSASRPVASHARTKGFFGRLKRRRPLPLSLTVRMEERSNVAP